MAKITEKTVDGNVVYDVDPENDTSIVLATADTYVDKNIVFNIDTDDAIVVTFTLGEAHTTPGLDVIAENVITADKTFAELKTAIMAGKKVYGKAYVDATHAVFIGYGTLDVATTDLITFGGVRKYVTEDDTTYPVTTSASYFEDETGLFYIVADTNSGGGTSTITYQQVIDALGYTPYNGTTNPNNYKSTVSSSDVTSALGFVPYDSSNPDEFVTKYVSTLNNYYTKTQVDSMIGVGMDVEVVETLPTTDISASTIYLIKSGQYYNQYMYIGSEWRLIGTTSIDLSAYSKTEAFADVAFTGDYTDLVNRPALATVATTGDYNDLSNKPTFPTNVSSFTNDSGYIRNSELAGIDISTFVNDVPYAKMSDIESLEDLDVDAIKRAIDLTEHIGTVTSVSGGTGLTGYGTTDVVINHSNSVTSVASYPSGESLTNGGSFTVRDVKYDTEGHITGSIDRTIKMSEIPVYDDTEVRSLITNEASLRASEDSSLSSDISALNTTVSGIDGRVGTLETNYTSLEARVKAIEDTTCVVYLASAAPSESTGEDGDIYIQY